MSFSGSFQYIQSRLECMEGKREQKAFEYLEKGRKMGHLHVQSLRFSRPQSLVGKVRIKTPLAVPGWLQVVQLSDITCGKHCACLLPLSRAEGEESPWASEMDGRRCTPSSLPFLNTSPQHCGISLLSGPKPREGRNRHGSPKKVSGREIRPSHSGNSGSSPAVNHRPPCLFPSPRATSVCVCVLTTRVTQTHASAPHLTCCWSWSQEPHNSVTKTSPFSWDNVASHRPPSQCRVWGMSE